MRKMDLKTTDIDLGNFYNNSIVAIENCVQF